MPVGGALQQMQIAGQREEAPTAAHAKHAQIPRRTQLERRCHTQGRGEGKGGRVRCHPEILGGIKVWMAGLSAREPILFCCSVRFTQEIIPQ